MKTKKKYRKWIILGVAVVILAAFSIWRPVKHPATQDYIVGSGNCQGTVDTAYYQAISDAFAIGADENGVAVFKNPAKALFVLRLQYARGLWAIQRECYLLPLTPLTYHPYGTYGWQITKGSPTAKEQALFVSHFMDIYENSF